MSEVFLNSKFVGTIDDPDMFVEQFKSERRKGTISGNVNIRFNKPSDSIEIESSKGRARRPLIVVKEGIPLLTEKILRQLEKGEMSWSDLVQQGVIEFLDATEEDDAFVAFTDKDVKTDHTHLEITPLAMFGVCTSLVPFSQHSPTPRVNMGSKNQKQALLQLQCFSLEFMVVFLERV